MDTLSDDIKCKILDNIKLETKIKYITYGDGEQNYSFFYKEYSKYRCCKLFNKYFIEENKKIFKNFFDNF